MNQLWEIKKTEKIPDRDLLHVILADLGEELDHKRDLLPLAVLLTTTAASMTSGTSSTVLHLWVPADLEDYCDNRPSKMPATKRPRKTATKTRPETAVKS